ncbi:hypothetical protein FQN55_007173 [Onygenales sp. PD_40]|nr:hypothetical protein FQN55_007173 [Onygenales sp. PD_40]KAK2771653.1 hypothetical protein FQN53_004946 [Emmonsiellopsis sp. PD_33]
MRSSFLLTLAFLAVNVFAGGYQGCLERVLLYYAYQIDELNDEKDQTLGSSCDKWDSKDKTCIGDEWTTCAKKYNKNKRCNFNQLMASLGKARPNDKLVGPKGADQNTKTPDIEETAKVLHKHYTSTVKNGIVPNYPAYKFLKGADGDYNAYIEKVGKVVNEGAKHRTPDNKELWDKFDDALEKLRVARVGDHGKFLIEAADAKLGSKMEIKRQNLGNNPVDPSEKWETVDWAATEDAAKKKGVADYESLIKGFKDEFYDKSTPAGRKADDHLVVMKSFKLVEDQARCRR